MSLTVKPINIVFKNFNKFWSKITENVNKNNGIHANFLKSLNLDNSP